MSISSFDTFSNFSLKAFDPDFAIVPIFSATSSYVIPIPLSLIVISFLSLSTEIVILKSLSSPKISLFVKDSNFNLSIASLAFEINSLKKISLFVYIECIIKFNNSFVSA